MTGLTKKIAWPLIFAIIVICFIQCSDKSTRGLVVANSGLILRSAPDKKSKRIHLLPKNSIVKILSEGHAETIDDRKAKWLKVRFNEMEGWIFGAYIVILKDFDIKGKAFSSGFGCDPVSYSEYFHKIQFHQDQTFVDDYQSAYNLGDPCSGSYFEWQEGFYRPGEIKSQYILTFKLNKESIEIDEKSCQNQKYRFTRVKHEEVDFYTSSCLNEFGKELNMIVDAKEGNWWIEIKP